MRTIAKWIIIIGAAIFIILGIMDFYWCMDAGFSFRTCYEILTTGGD